MGKAAQKPLISLELNALDRAIAYFAPRVAAKRMAARGQMAIVGAYTGARFDRAALNRWNPHAGSAVADTVSDLPTLRSRSRDQMRNAPMAVGALNTTVSHVVGTGLTLSPALNAKFLGLTQEQADEWQADTAMRYAAWASSLDCDLSRNLNFYGLQELAFRTVLESGDGFVVTPLVQRPGRARRQLVLQLIEADRVCNPNNNPDTEELICGLEIDKTTGEAKACHIARRHPGDWGAGNDWDRRELRSPSGRRNVIHLFKQLRPGQPRGVPWIAPILEPLKKISQYTDAELQAAVVSGLFSVFIKMDQNAFATLFDEDAQGAIVNQKSQWSGELESGKAINLLPGESIDAPNPGRPNPQFDPFLTSVLRQIGVALELPYEVLVMHYQSSYSAARAALLMAWKFFRSRRDWLATYFCQPVYELWLSEEVMAGTIRAPGFFADELVRTAWCQATWTGDGPGSIDPAKEVTAAKERVDMGISTLNAESILHDGIPWAVKHAQRTKEIAAQRRDGMLPAAGQRESAPGTSGAPGSSGDPDPEEDPEDPLPADR